jgi:hypothetical protein
MSPEDPEDYEETERLEQEAKIEAQRRQKQEEEDIAWVASDARGRRFLWRLLGACHVSASVFSEGRPDRTAYLAGQQDIGHWAQRQLMAANPSLYTKMQDEAQKTFIKEERRNGKH